MNTLDRVQCRPRRITKRIPRLPTNRPKTKREPILRRRGWQLGTGSPRDLLGSSTYFAE